MSQGHWMGLLKDTPNKQVFFCKGALWHHLYGMLQWGWTADSPGEASLGFSRRLDWKWPFHTSPVLNISLKLCSLSTVSALT